MNDEASLKDRIDLGKVKSGRALFEQKVADAEALLQCAMAELQDYDSNQLEAIKQRLSGGQTTGDPLHDEAIQVFRLKSECHESVLGFGKKMQAAKGQECLFVFRWQELTKHTGRDPEAGDYSPATAYILGILSGERLKIGKRDPLTAVLGVTFYAIMPFDCSVSWGFRLHGSRTGFVRHRGELDVGEETEAGSLVDDLLLFLGGVSSTRIGISCHIGDEVADVAILPTTLDEARQALAEEAEAEKKEQSLVSNPS